MYKNLTKKSASGFTLLELLIVIAIVATLSVVSVVVLNPSEMLKKSRDSQRISDLTTLKKAIGLYITNVASPKLAGANNTGCKGTSSSTAWDKPNDHIYYSYPTESGDLSNVVNMDSETSFPTGFIVQASRANLANTDGTGWIPIDFSSLPEGSPISNLPVDPTNTIADVTAPTNTDLVYRYTCSQRDLTYEISSTLESEAYTVTENKMSKDGGNSDSYYESGTSLSILTSESFTPTYALRDTGPGGGLVFYISDGGLHGLEAAPSSTEWATKQWGCFGSSITGADGIVVGTGAQNTIDIVNGCAEADRAARLASDLVSGGKSDWFLPSKDELNLMYTQLKAQGVGGFSSSLGYWSSSESSSTIAWIRNFSSGTQGGYNKYDTLYVRAVRAF
jgi:prepilin-type N-terminal cleavage/methylation domain-containing protein